MRCVAPLRILRREERKNIIIRLIWIFVFIYLLVFFHSVVRTVHFCVCGLSQFFSLYYLSFEYSFISLYSNSEFFLLSQIVRLCVVLVCVCVVIGIFFCEFVEEIERWQNGFVVFLSSFWLLIPIYQQNENREKRPYETKKNDPLSSSLWLSLLLSLIIAPLKRNNNHI